MRRRLIVAALLSATALVLLLWLGPRARPEAPAAPGSVTRAGPRRAGPDPRAPSSPGASAPAPDTAPAGSDGVLALEVLAAGQPVSGAEARLYRRGGYNTSLGVSVWEQPVTGLTDARGQLRLAAPPGGYVVAVHASGHPPRVAQVTRPQAQALTSLRLVLDPGQELAGRTVVKGHPGEELPLVQLSLTFIPRDLPPGAYMDLPPEERVAAQSDARGRFRVEGLAAGHYLVEAEAPGHARAWMYPVRVPAEQPLEVALSAAGVLEGFVVDSRGAAVEDAEVHVNGETPQSVRTGPGGGFSAEVEAGTYSVTARHGEETGALGHSLTLSAGRTQGGLRLQLGPGAVLEGRVWEPGSGAPVVGAQIAVSPYGENGDLGRESTDEQGHFRVSALPTGSYDVVVTRAGFSPAMRRGVTLAPRETFPLDIPLSRLGEVEGWVRDEDGQPVGGALVLAPNPDPEELDATPRETRSDATGHYRLEGLNVGFQKLSARRQGATQGNESRVEIGPEGTARLDFTLKKTGGVEGVVRAVRGSLPSRDLEVFALLDDERGASEAELGRTLVGAQGDFRMELPAGNYSLVLSAQGESPHFQTTNVRVEMGQTTRTELLWEETSRSRPAKRSVEGLVREPDGTPSPGATVVLVDEGPENALLDTQRTDETGHFSLNTSRSREEASEHWTVRAVNGGRGGEVSGVRPGERSLAVSLRAAASLRGRVIRTSGSVRGFTLELEPERERASPGRGPWHFSGERFELPEVPAGPLRVLVSTPDGARGEVQVLPRPGQPSEVDIPVHARASVRGRGVDADTREPVSDLRASLPSSGMKHEAVSRAGRFAFDGLEPGEHVIRLRRVLPSSNSGTEETRTVRLSEGENLDLGDVPLRRPTPRVPAAPGLPE